MNKRGFFKTAGCVVSGSAVCLSGCAPVAFCTESSVISDLHSGTSEETTKIIKALCRIRGYVVAILNGKGFNEGNELSKEAKSLHDEIKELLELTNKCCSENKNVNFSLAIQEALSDILKGMYTAKGELIKSSEIYRVNGDLQSGFERSALVGLKKIRSLCGVCKRILKNIGNDYSYEAINSEAADLICLRFYLGYWKKEDKNEDEAKKLIKKLNAKGYDYSYEDELLLQKVTNDLSLVEGTWQCFDDVREFANNSYTKIFPYKENSYKAKEVLAVIMKEILGSDYAGGLFRFLAESNEHVGISNETKEKIIGALDHLRDLVVTSYAMEGIPVDHVLYEYANSLHDEIEELLNLTVECCSEGKNVAFSLAIQKVLSDIFKGVYNTKGEMIDLDTLGYISLPKESINNALCELMKMRGLCRACKEILEDKKDEKGHRSNFFTEEDVSSQAYIFNSLRAILENSPDDKSRIDRLIDGYRKIFRDPGYKYGDESLLDKVTEDSKFFTDLDFSFRNTRSFIYDSYEKIDMSAIHFNPIFEENLKSSGIIRCLYPYFISLAIKDKLNKLFDKKYLGMYNLISKLDKNLSKKPIDEKLSKEKQVEQLKGHKELNEAMLEHKRNVIKCSVSKFLNNEEKNKLNKALEPSGYEFLLPIYSQLSK